jgi:hypothetical protein
MKGGKNPKYSTGQVAQFKLPPKSEGVVLQYVEHASKFAEGSSTDLIRNYFTEGWEVRRGAGIFPDKGRDFFLVPEEYHADKGSVQIRAYSWFVAATGKETPESLLAKHGLRKGGSVISGILPSKKGRMKTKDIPGNYIDRKWQASWAAAASVRDWKLKYKYQTRYVMK